MKKLLYILLITSIAACGGKEVKNTENAAAAMERARLAEAPTYAATEYNAAEIEFNAMNRALDMNELESANAISWEVIVKADLATETAQQNKAAALIRQLQSMISARTNMRRTQPVIYTNVLVYLNSAQTAYTNANYPRAITEAQNGINFLNNNPAGVQIMDPPMSSRNQNNTPNSSAGWITRRVGRGDTLWDLSEEYYNTPWKWPYIYDANRDVISNPHKIYPSMVIRIPPLSATEYTITNSYPVDYRQQ